MGGANDTRTPPPTSAPNFGDYILVYPATNDYLTAFVVATGFTKAFSTFSKVSGMCLMILVIGRPRLRFLFDFSDIGNLPQLVAIQPFF